MSTKNIVLFGQPGVGKSSVINLMAGSQRAETSSDAERCTSRVGEYLINFDGCDYRVFDTIGLHWDRSKTQECVDAIASAYSLIAELNREGGTHLLLFCVRAGRIDSTTQNNYKLFREFFCDKKVPICLVVTGLEEEEIMDSWWIEYRQGFDSRGIDVNGHVCITAVDGVNPANYKESRRLICDLVVQHTQNGTEGIGPEKCSGWFGRLVHTLKEWYLKFSSTKKKRMINVLVEGYDMPREVAEQVAGRITQLENRPVVSHHGTLEILPGPINQAEEPGAHANATIQGSS